MDTVLQIFLLWATVIIGLAVGYSYFGASFVIWVAGGLAIFALLPIPIPDFTNPIEIGTWGLIAAAYLLTWYIFIKPPTYKKPEAKLSKDLLVGESGVAVEAPEKAGGFMIEFPHPIQGLATWPIIKLDELTAGDKIIVVDTIGKSLVVNKLQTQEWNSGSTDGTESSESTQ